MKFNILKFILLVSMLALTCKFISAQTNSEIIYKAYINNDMVKWKSIISKMEKEGNTKIEQKLELVNYYYGYIAYLLGVKKYDVAPAYINKGEAIIDEILKQSPRNSTVTAYKGSFIAFKIGLSKFKALSLGKESSNYLIKALKLDPSNFQANIDNANALFHTPKFFGGDKKASLKLYLNSIRIIESKKLTSNNWQYINALSLAGRNYVYLEEYNKAKTIYDKVLALEPNFTWVKNDLYPRLLEKIK